MPRTLQPCGTEAAYRRHKRNKEDACERCIIANRDGSKLRMRRYYRRHRKAAV